MVIANSEPISTMAWQNKQRLHHCKMGEESHTTTSISQRGVTRPNVWIVPVSLFGAGVLAGFALFFMLVERPYHDHLALTYERQNATIQAWESKYEKLIEDRDKCLQNHDILQRDLGEQRGKSHVYSNWLPRHEQLVEEYKSLETQLDAYRNELSTLRETMQLKSQEQEQILSEARKQHEQARKAHKKEDQLWLKKLRTARQEIETLQQQRYECYEELEGTHGDHAARDLLLAEATSAANRLAQEKESMVKQWKDAFDLCDSKEKTSIEQLKRRDNVLCQQE